MAPRFIPRPFPLAETYRKAIDPMMRCGELGHKNRDGDPCAKRQGWGIKGADAGPCRYHTESVRGTRKALKKRVVEYLARPELTLLEVGRKVGRAPHTIWRWRQHDEEFDRRCIEAMAAADRVRVRIVEDSLYKRIISDRLNPAETIWFLKNPCARSMEGQDRAGGDGSERKAAHLHRGNPLIDW